nr:ATP-dependent DNA ligase [Nocardioides perillae]
MLAHVVQTSAAVAATRSRKEKVAALASLLRRLPVDPDPLEVEVLAHLLGGSLRQRRTGLGWRGLRDLPPPAEVPTLTVLGVDAAFESLASLAGPGSQAARAAAVAALFGAATAGEQPWLRGVVTGEVRQGALDALVQEAVAAASGAALASVRRAAMLAGSTTRAAVAALTGGEEALAAFALEVGRPVEPMLASSATDVAEALAKAGGAEGREVAVDLKLDGIRVQVHRDGDDVLVVTRSLDDITARLPEVVDVVRALPAEHVVLDGEALTVGPDGRPRPFQETASRTARRGAEAHGTRVTPYFFDVLHLDGRDLLTAPAHERAAALDALVPAEHRVPRVVTADPAEAARFAREAVECGHEGVVVKSLEAAYEAGRRGAAWVKVKPVHTLDLVVLAVERGSGRRSAWLSNIHLGALDPEATAREGEPRFTMLGKTFKGMTDEVLAWQTERFRALEVADDGYVVTVRPEQVVEVAFDGVQRSTRYPGGVALRFARVVRYRDDKVAAEADTLEAVRAHLPG